MRKLTLVILLTSTLGVSKTANAQLGLQVFQSSGETWMVNAGTDPVEFDGYLISDSANPGQLVPGNWRSIDSVNDQFHPHYSEAVSDFGSGIVGFSEATSTPQSLAELKLGPPPFAVMQPAARWHLGHLFPSGLPLGPAPSNFAFSVNGTSGDVGTFIQVVVPEPSSLLLAGLGLIGLAVYVRRRK